MHPFFDFFNKERPYIDLDSSKWPREWTTITWKAYPRFPRIDLPKPDIGDSGLKDAIIHRKSSRDFSEKPLSLKEMSGLLFYSCGITKPNENRNLIRRAHPSGGALFPLELYALVFKDSEELPQGVYHYNVLEHVLEKIPGTDFSSFYHAFPYPWARDASLVFLFTYNEERNKMKYGNLAYKVALIEAGHIGQNIYLVSSAMNLKCCPLGAANEKIIHKELDIDGIKEVFFYAIAIGK